MADWDISPDERRQLQMQNLWGALAQSGAMLMAAGAPVSDGQRAMLLAQSAMPFANMGQANQEAIRNAQRERMYDLQMRRMAQTDQQKQAAEQQWNTLANGDEVKNALAGMTPAQRTLAQFAIANRDTGALGRMLTPAKPTEGDLKRAEILRAVGGDQETADRIHAGVQKMVVGPDGQPYVVNVATGEVISGKVGNKPPPPAFQKLGTEAESMYSALDNFKTVISEASNGGRIQAYLGNPRSPEAQKIDGAYQALKAALRSEAFLNTGVLQPGENKMIDEMLLHPRSASGLLASPEAYAAKLGEFQKFIDGRMAGAYKAYNIEPPQRKQAPTGITKEQYDALPSGAEFVAPDGSRRRKP